MKKAIKIETSANYCDRKVEGIGVGEAEYDPESGNFWINTNFLNAKDGDDYMTISVDAAELLRIVGECIADPLEF